MEDLNFLQETHREISDMFRKHLINQHVREVPPPEFYSSQVEDCFLVVHHSVTVQIESLTPNDFYISFFHIARTKFIQE